MQTRSGELSNFHGGSSMAILTRGRAVTGKVICVQKIETTELEQKTKGRWLLGTSRTGGVPNRNQNKARRKERRDAGPEMEK